MKTFFVGIKGVIIKDDKVLLIKSSGEREFWEVPGGRMDENETIEQTLQRELSEEVPNISNIRTQKVLDAFRVPRDIKDNISLVLIFYHVTADFDGEIQLSDEHTEYKWADESEALEIVDEGCITALKNAFRDLK